MTKKINPSDWETISAYVDNEVSPAERAQIEVRLDSEPELRSLLEEVKRTQAIVKSLEPVRAPRDFTLTPAMAGIPERRTWAAPAFQWASAFAMILFVLVIAGDFSGVLRPELPVESAIIQEVAVPTLAAEFGLEADVLPQVEEEAAPNIGEALEAPAENQGFVKSAETPEAPSAADSAEELPAESDLESGITTTAEPQADDGEPEEAPQSNTILLRIFEAGLAITALILALAALILRRRAV